MNNVDGFIYYPLVDSCKPDSFGDAVKKAKESSFFHAGSTRKIGIYKLVAVIECEHTFSVRKVEDA